MRVPSHLDYHIVCHLLSTPWSSIECQLHTSHSIFDCVYICCFIGPPVPKWGVPLDNISSKRDELRVLSYETHVGDFDRLDGFTKGLQPSVREQEMIKIAEWVGEGDQTRGQGGGVTKARV